MMNISLSRSVYARSETQNLCTSCVRGCSGRNNLAAVATLSVGIRFFALAVLMNVEIGTREAVALLVLFVSQVVAEFYVIQTYAEPTFTNISILILYASTAVYIVLGVGLFVKRYGSLRKLIEHLPRTSARER